MDSPANRLAVPFQVSDVHARPQFIIKNGDIVKVMLDQKSMFDRLVKNKPTDDIFIERRMKFIDQIIKQRDLDVRYQLIDPSENKATKLLLS